MTSTVDDVTESWSANSIESPGNAAILNSRDFNAKLIQDTEMRDVQIIPVCSLHQGLGSPKDQMVRAPKTPSLVEPPIPISPDVYRWSLCMRQVHNRSVRSSPMLFLMPLPHQSLHLTNLQSIVNLAQRCPSSRVQVHIASRISSTKS